MSPMWLQLGVFLWVTVVAVCLMRGFYASSMTRGHAKLHGRDLVMRKLFYIACLLPVVTSLLVWVCELLLPCSLTARRVELIAIALAYIIPAALFDSVRCLVVNIPWSSNVFRLFLVGLRITVQLGLAGALVGPLTLTSTCAVDLSEGGLQMIYIVATMVELCVRLGYIMLFGWKLREVAMLRESYDDSPGMSDRKAQLMRTILILQRNIIGSVLTLVVLVGTGAIMLVATTSTVQLAALVFPQSASMVAVGFVLIKPEAFLCAKKEEETVKKPRRKELQKKKHKDKLVAFGSQDPEADTSHAIEMPFKPEAGPALPAFSMMSASSQGSMYSSMLTGGGVETPVISEVQRNSDAKAQREAAALLQGRGILTTDFRQKLKIADTPGTPPSSSVDAGRFSVEPSAFPAGYSPLNPYKSSPSYGPSSLVGGAYGRPRLNSDSANNNQLGPTVDQSSPRSLRRIMMGRALQGAKRKEANAKAMMIPQLPRLAGTSFEQFLMKPGRDSAPMSPTSPHLRPLKPLKQGGLSTVHSFNDLFAFDLDNEDGVIPAMDLDMQPLRSNSNFSMRSTEEREKTASPKSISRNSPEPASPKSISKAAPEPASPNSLGVRILRDPTSPIRGSPIRKARAIMPPASPEDIPTIDYYAYGELQVGKELAMHSREERETATSPSPTPSSMGAHKRGALREAIVNLLRGSMDRGAESPAGSRAECEPELGMRSDEEGSLASDEGDEAGEEGDGEEQDVELHAALMQGASTEAIEILIDKDADFDEARQNRSLLIALEHGACKAIVQLLLAEGADPNCDKDGLSALMIAQQHGSLAVVELLIAEGADNSGDHDQDLGMRSGSEPELAMRSDSEGSVSDYVEEGDAEEDDEEKDVDLHMALREGASQEQIEVLMDKDADFDEERQNCSLLIALKHGASKGVVQLLLSEGADPNACGEDGMSALMIALHGGASKEVVGLLLTSGADANPEEQERAATLMDALAAGLSKEKVEAANVEEPELEMRSNDNSPPSLVDDIVAGRGSRKGSMDLARALQTLGRLRQSIIETPKVPAPRPVLPEPKTPPQQPRGRGLLSRPTPVNSPQSRFLAHSRRASLEPDVLL